HIRVKLLSTGSGSLSHAILRTIAPNGHLNTFDFHEQRAQKAREEFESHGFADLVTASHRDVCSAGFGLNLEVDAVFLDLPAPWTAIASAKQAIKLLGGRICSFSPCIEQVQRTCLALTEHDFTEVCTMECLLRTFDVRRVCMPAVLDLGDALCEDSSEPAPNKQPKLSDAHSVSSEATTAGEDHGPHGTPKMAKGDIFFKASVPPLQMAAHTGYLTFATLSPRLVTD
ncbi:PREDICTED: tRNA (adenine(58)-N(1))-methyltransferase catalytic subunit TRMT61A-like, partial [Priapulus caudatus]|uniref:tRNA (adenine(58)-N(1))-methyltransferase n=1 Tax=Priapulus caudatus TaxID=37621 RepID=A0ABM1E0S9_PRICU